MMDPEEIELHYEHYMRDLKQFLPDGIIDIDLEYLSDLGLLTETPLSNDDGAALTHNFYVVESQEKLTLFNQKYVIWIVPKVVDQAPVTYTLIALHEEEDTHLEMAFTTRGVYNHSSMVLKILEKFLEQIDENERELCKLRPKN